MSLLSEQAYEDARETYAKRRAEYEETYAVTRQCYAESAAEYKERPRR